MSRRPALLFLLALTFCLGVLVGHGVRRQPRQPLPDSPIGLAGRLESRGLSLRYIPAPWGDAILTETDAPAEKLLSLWRDPRRIPEWSGTVYVERDRGHGEVDDSGWGECGCRVGNLLIFGDPKLVRRIKSALR